jgi:SRSO17 transposase
MSLLEHPQAQALLQDAVLTSAAVVSCRERLEEYLQRYLPWFYRQEQRDAARVILQGKFTNLQRKTSEPIARQAKLKRRPLQHFVGAGKWDDQAVLRQLWQHVGEELGDPQAVLIVDPSGFAKKGTESCGVGRQWLGQHGKVDNGQVGVFVSYAAAAGHTLVASRLYLPEDWAADPKRREQCFVPQDVVFQEKWRLGLDLLEQVSPCLPHGWVVGDDELGRATEFRAALRRRRERYVLDVPCNTLVREIDPTQPRGAFERIEAWAKRQPTERWKSLRIRAGEKGPVRVLALKRRVQTKDEDGRVGPAETALVLRTLGKDGKLSYALSNAARDEDLMELVRPKLERHRVEEDLEAGKQEIGLSHYEVRSWVGWHHHMTLSLLALWFLVLEAVRLKKKLQP